MDIPQTPNTNPTQTPASPAVSAPVQASPQPAAPASVPTPAPAFNLGAAPAPISAPTPDSAVRSFMPSAPSATQGLPKTSFFSGKVLAALIALAVIIGGVALGFFAFPEPFYNYVGKYLGLPAPTSLQEQAPTVNKQPAPPSEPTTEQPAAVEPTPEQPAVGSTTDENTAQTEEGTETDIQTPLTGPDASAGTGTEEIIDIGAPTTETTGEAAVTDTQPTVNSGGKVPRNKNN